MLKHWIAVLMLPVTMVQGAVITSIGDGKPESKGWKMTGTIPAVVTADVGQKVLVLKDESSSDSCGYLYMISDADTARIKKDGFTLRYRVRQRSGEAFPVTLRIVDVGSGNFGLWRDETKKDIHVKSWDANLGKHVGVMAGKADDVVDLIAVWRPGSNVEVKVKGGPEYSFPPSAPRNSLEFGGPDVSRQGHQIIERLELTSP
jgi:hypothetical protein